MIPSSGKRTRSAELSLTSCVTDVQDREARRRRRCTPARRAPHRCRRYRASSGCCSCAERCEREHRSARSSHTSSPVTAYVLQQRVAVAGGPVAEASGPFSSGPYRQVVSAPPSSRSSGNRSPSVATIPGAPWHHCTRFGLAADDRGPVDGVAVPDGVRAENRSIRRAELGVVDVRRAARERSRRSRAPAR